MATIAFMSGRAAAEEVAALLDEREGAALPVLPPGVHHVEMAEQQHRLGGPRRARHDRDDAAVEREFGVGEERQLSVREAGRLQVRGDLLRGGGAAAGRDGRVDLDQLAVKIAEGELVGAGRGRRLRRHRRRRGG
jgi:hypothetical protein